MYGRTTPLEAKLFGKTLSRTEAETLAMHFIIKQEEENPLIIYGDPVVTEYLNYFTLKDGDVINGYHWLIEEDEYVYDLSVADTMMDEAYAQEAIKDIKSLKDSQILR